MPTRAKFRCQTETLTRWTAQMEPQRTYEFQAIYDQALAEDRSFAKSTPSGSLKIMVDNPAVTFEPGHAYYLDITPADDGNA